MATNWNIGERIQNRWEVHKILRGGMGVVYVVYDPEFRDVFATKTFQDEAFARNPEVAGRFMQEALAWVNLDAHQNVAQARFVQIITGKPYLFLEYVSGGDLSSWIGTPRLIEDPPQVLRFAIQFCDGMTHALSKGITAHRDIKPQNCLITQDRMLKVTDFGLAKVFGAAVAEDAATPPPGMSVGLSRTGAVAGTCTHMAPEQFDDAKHVDVRADIYSFGVMLYQMVTGKLPFEGRSWLEFEQLHKTQRVPPIESKPIEFGGIVRQCLAKDPSNRYSRFDEIREELAEIYVKLTGEVAPQPVRGVELDAVKLGNKGISLSALGQTDQALECYERALTINPCLAEVWSAKGVVLKELHSTDDALACHDHALELKPLLQYAWCNKGATLLEVGRNEEAIHCCDHALELDPFYVEAWANKGVALARLGRNEEADACYDRSLELDPRYEKAWHNKGVALARLGNYEGALACFNRSLAVNERFVDSWWNKGALLIRLGREEEAIDCCTCAINLNPRSVRAWSTKALALIAIGQHEEALSCYDRALELDPHNDSLWLNKANILRSLGQYREAIIGYERAIKLNPRNADAWYDKGTTLIKHDGDLAQAHDCFEQAKQLGHEQAALFIKLNQQRLEAEEWFKKGQDLSAKGRYEEAVACYDNALALDSDDDALWHNKAIALRKLARHEEAVACYDRALELKPGDGKTWSSKAVALGALGRHEEELTCCERALELNPNHATAWSNKGSALWALQKPEQALVCYDRAIELDPHDSQAWMNKGAVLVNAFQRYDQALACFEEAQRLGQQQAARVIEQLRQALGQQ